MDVRIQRISRMGTDFSLSFRRNLSFLRKDKEKYVLIREIRKIRTLYVCSEKEESSIFATKRSKEWIQTVVHLGVNPV
ncbi:MAG: hypothetical protein RLZZ628_3819, partial [Bacteroidota bacterium]